MSAIPGPITHAPGAYHAFDPINCSSDASWHQQQTMMQYAAMADQHQLAVEEQTRAGEAARQRQQLEDDVLLLIG